MNTFFLKALCFARGSSRRAHFMGVILGVRQPRACSAEFMVRKSNEQMQELTSMSIVMRGFGFFDDVVMLLIGCCCDFGDFFCGQRLYSAVSCYLLRRQCRSLFSTALWNIPCFVRSAVPKNFPCSVVSTDMNIPCSVVSADT